MNTQALLAALRETLDDETAPHLWEDGSLVRKLNNAVREACLRARLLKDDEESCPELCRIPVRAGQSTVRYAPEVLVARHGRMDGDGCGQLWALTAESMDTFRPDWQATPPSPGAPEVMVMDLAQKRLRLWPTPDQDSTLLLRVWRTPMKKELMRLDGDDCGPVIKLPDPEELCHWAAYEAYMQADAEMQDKAAASQHLSLFEQRFGTRPSLHEMARWADSPPRIRRAVMF